MPEPLFAWLLTYLVHSTLLLGGVWLLTRAWRRMPVAWGEALWRAAVLGGVLTATTQLAFDVDPAGGRVAVPRAPSAVVANGTTADGTTAASVAAASPVPPATDDGPSSIDARPEPLAATDAATPVRAVPGHARLPGWTWFALVWASGCVLGLVRGGRARGRLRTRLAARTRLVDGPLHARLAALVERAGLRRTPRLSAAPGLGSPLAVGVLRPEIVVPTRATTELTSEQQAAMLAHELAHHIRRDALWQSALRALTMLFFFQPLHLVARRRLHESAELLCDAWAVEQTGSSRSLAECLTVVAGWMVRGSRAHPAPAMAAHGSMLRRRVERLVDHDLPSAAPHVRVGAGLLAVLLLVAVVWVAPAVAMGTADGPSPVDRSALARALASAPVDPMPAPSVDVPVRDGAAVARVDEELVLLEQQLTTLLDLLAQVEDPPAALRLAAGRLESRLESLKTRRAVLRDAPPAKEMAR